MSLGQVTTHQCDRAPAMTLYSFHAMPPSTRVHAHGTGRVEPHHRDSGRPAGCFDRLDQVDDMPSATGLGDNEHTCEPRGQIGPLVQVVIHETGGSDWFAVNQQDKTLRRPRWRYRCSDRIICLFGPPVTRRQRSEALQRLPYSQTSSGLSVVIISADA